MQRKVHPKFIEAGIDDYFKIPISENELKENEKNLFPAVMVIDGKKTYFRKINFDKLNEDFELIYQKNLILFFQRKKAHNYNPIIFIENELQHFETDLPNFSTGEPNHNLLSNYISFL